MKKEQNEKQNELGTKTTLTEIFGMTLSYLRGTNFLSMIVHLVLLGLMGYYKSELGIILGSFLTFRELFRYAHESMVYVAETLSERLDEEFEKNTGIDIYALSSKCWVPNLEHLVGPNWDLKCTEES